MNDVFRLWGAPTLLLIIFIGIYAFDKLRGKNVLKKNDSPKRKLLKELKGLDDSASFQDLASLVEHLKNSDQQQK